MDTASLRRFGSVALLALAAGCASAPLRGRTDLLGFVVDGATPREEAIQRLGEPSARLQQGRICTWRIAHDAAGAYVAAGSSGSGWAGVDASLVLVFDAAGRLERHALVPVRAP